MESRHRIKKAIVIFMFRPPTEHVPNVALKNILPVMFGLKQSKWIVTDWLLRTN